MNKRVRDPEIKRKCTRKCKGCSRRAGWIVRKECSVTVSFYGTYETVRECSIRVDACTTSSA